MDTGLFNHQPRRVTNGIQKSKNWMLKSLATAPSAEKDTIGRRTMPNHLC